MSGRSGFSLILLQQTHPVYRDKGDPLPESLCGKAQVFRLDWKPNIQKSKSICWV